MEAPALVPATAQALFSIETLRRALASHVPTAPEHGETRGAASSRPAAVLVPIYRRGSSWKVLLCQRSDKVPEHRGEVAFPGGRMEQSDASLEECALREAWEEVGLEPKAVTVLGRLDPVNTRTGYLVWPTVAIAPDSYAFTPNADEVAGLLEVSLDWLLTDESLLHETLLQPEGFVVRRRAYTFGPHLIYGATALMLTQLLGLCRHAADELGPRKEQR